VIDYSCYNLSSLLFLDPILLLWTHESLLLSMSLEATMAKLGRGVNELQIDLLESGSLGVGQQRLAQSDGSLLRTHQASLQHQEVVGYFTVVRETTHRSDGLLGLIVLGGCVVLHDLSFEGVDTTANTVDLLVHFRSVVISLLTGTSNGKLHTTRMPCTNASDLSQTLVGLSGQLLGVPTAGHSLKSFALGDSNAVNHLVFSKDRADWHGLLEVLAGPFDLLGNSSSVQLDFHDVRLLLTLTQQLHLSVCENANHGAVLLHPGKVLLNVFLAGGISPLLGVLGESLLVGLVPVLVEATAAIFAKVLSPDGLEHAETLWSFDVPNGSNDNHRWCLQDGNSLYHFFLIHLGTGLVHFADDVGHSGLVGDESRKVDRLLLVVFGERLRLTTVVLCTLLGRKAHRAVARRGKLSVRHHCS